VRPGRGRAILKAKEGAWQGPGEGCSVVGVVDQAGDDPVDAPAPRALGCGPRVPLSEAGGSPTPLMGQTVRVGTACDSKVAPAMNLSSPEERRQLIEIRAQDQ